MTLKFLDRILLEAAAFIFRRAPWLPARPLNWIGFDLYGKGLFSERWARQGVLPLRSRTCRKWHLLNIGYANQRYTYVYGVYAERVIVKYFRRVLREGDVFIDIGANIGMLTLEGSSLVGPSGHTFAVEANTAAYSILKGHVVLNRMWNVRTFQIAMGSTPGVAKLQIPHGNKPNQRLAESTWGNLRNDEPDDCESVSVMVDTGDNLLNDIPVGARGVCKIDVEGYEMEVLLGMQHFIESHPNVQYCVEVTDQWLEACSGVNSEQLIAWFLARGFSGFVLKRDGSKSPLRTRRIEQQMDIVFARSR